MRAITLLQPYATLIALRAKKIETRSWSTGYRGPLAIHAGSGKPDWCRAVAEHDPLIAPLLKAAGYTFDTLPRGGILATATLYDVVRFIDPAQPDQHRAPRTLDPAGLAPLERACGDFTPGRFGFGLKDLVVLPELIPCAGALSIWSVPDHLLPLLTPQPAATPH